jgi:hypothetical protein
LTNVLEKLTASIFRITVKMEVIRCPETLVNNCKTAGCHNPEDHNTIQNKKNSSNQTQLLT